MGTIRYGLVLIIVKILLEISSGNFPVELLPVEYILFPPPLRYSASYYVSESLNRRSSVMAKGYQILVIFCLSHKNENFATFLHVC